MASTWTDGVHGRRPNSIQCGLPEKADGLCCRLCGCEDGALIMLLSFAIDIQGNCWRGCILFVLVCFDCEAKIPRQIQIMDEGGDGFSSAREPEKPGTMRNEISRSRHCRIVCAGSAIHPAALNPWLAEEEEGAGAGVPGREGVAKGAGKAW